VISRKLHACLQSTPIYIAHISIFAYLSGDCNETNLAQVVWNWNSTQSTCAALNCHLWSVSLYHIFPHYLTHGTMFSKKLLNIKYLLIFSINFVWNISYPKKSWARYYHKCTCLHVKYPLFLGDCNETCIFSIYFRKTRKYKISWKFVEWEPLFHVEGWTHRNE